MHDQVKLPDFDDVAAAAGRIKGQAVRTPLLNSAYLDDVAGCRVYLKPECLQRTGSFKFRGAFNTISSMTDDERKNGVVAVSSGNHAQGVADAARIFGIDAVIAMEDPVLRNLWITHTYHCLDLALARHFGLFGHAIRNEPFAMLHQHDDD